MTCCDPRCTKAGQGDQYCRECGGMFHLGESSADGCSCLCWLQTCPACGHTFIAGDEVETGAVS